MIGMMVWASRPDMQLLYGGLTPEETGKMIDAIEKGLEAILEHKEAVVKEYNEQKAAGKFHFINLEAWMQCAEAIQSKFRNKYN